MAPEQIDKKQPLSPATDIYALGAILYHILTFNAPLDGEIDTILDHTLKGLLPSIDNAYPNLAISNSLKAIVKQSMSLNPQQRYQSIEQLQQDVKFYLAGYATKAEHAGFIKECRLFYRRNRSASILSILILTLLISLMGVSIIVQHLQERQKALISEYTDFKSQSGSFYFKGENFFIDPENTVNNAIKEFKEVLELYPQHDSALKNLSEAYFISHRFEAMLALMKDHNLDGLYNVGQFYAPKLDPATQRLPPSDFKKLIEQLLKRLASARGITLVEKMLAYSLLFPEYKQHNFDLVKLILKHKNPNWLGDGIIYNPKESSLKIMSPDLNELHDRKSQNGGYSYLRFLDFKQLDLSYSKITSFESLRALSLHHLNIAHSKITALSKLRELNTLKSLTIHRHQFKEQELDKLKRANPELEVIIIE